MPYCLCIKVQNSLSFVTQQDGGNTRLRNLCSVFLQITWCDIL